MSPAFTVMQLQIKTTATTNFPREMQVTRSPQLLQRTDANKDCFSCGLDSEGSAAWSLQRCLLGLDTALT